MCVFLYTLTGRIAWGHFVWQSQWVNKTPGEYIGIVYYIIYYCVTYWSKQPGYCLPIIINPLSPLMDTKYIKCPSTSVYNR